MSEKPTVSSLEKVEAILNNPAIYELARAIPGPARSGRRRDYPTFMILVFNSLLSVWRSGRQVEAELSHPLVWRHMRRIIRRRFPDDPSMHLPQQPMRRHHYVYGRDRYLTDPAILERLGEIHRELATGQAKKAGLLDPEGPGSYTHPHLSRVLHADGKVVTPLFKARPGQFRVDTDTGELTPVRFEADAALHFEGDGEAAWGTKFVMVATRSPVGRFILDLDRVPDPGSEAAVAVSCFERLAPHVPGTQAIVYDTALRGVHHQKILRELGIVPVNMVAAAETFASKTLKRKIKRREKTVHVEDKEVGLPDGSSVTIRLFSEAGAIGIMRPTEAGELQFTPLVRKRTHRMKADSGLYRWYNDYRLPEHIGPGQITVRLHQNDVDRKRRFNRTENVRPIPPSDPDFPRLYGRRNDSESLNRPRGHSVPRPGSQSRMAPSASRDARLGADGERHHDGPPQSRRGSRSGRLTQSTPGTTSARINAVPNAPLKPRWRYQGHTRLHSLHSNALVKTSVAISAGFSTGPGWVGVVGIPDPAGQRAAHVTAVTEFGRLVTA